MKRMLWPRILYWGGIATTVFWLFYAITGMNGSSSLVAKSDTQTGAAVLAAIGVLAMIGAKAWMDAVVRARSRLACPACNVLLDAVLPHCPNCGAPQRTTPRILQALADPPGEAVRQHPTFCSTCGAEAAPTATFCRACGRALVTTNGLVSA